MLLRLLSVFGVFATGLLQVTCSRTKSLTFVVSDTSNLETDVFKMNGIMSAVHESAEFAEIAVITFDDQNAVLQGKSNASLDFISGIMFTYDCPKYTLSGIELALLESKPGSYIYAFADASGKDFDQIDRIIDLCHNTQSKVIFVLTGKCHRPSRWNYQVCHKIASASSGMVIEIEENEVNLLVQTIGTFIRGRMNPITSVVLPPQILSEVPLTIDEKTQSVIISASGNGVELDVKGLNSEILMNVKKFKMVQLNNLEPGTYTISVKSASSTYLVVYGRTDFTFQHGFSEFKPKKITDTSRKPLPDQKNHLSVYVDDPDGSVQIETAQILTMDENVVIHELTLKELNDDLYITEPFESPDDMFKIAVNGHIMNTGKAIKRIARTPTEPQFPALHLLSNYKKPTATITEGPTYAVMYGCTVTLTCKVHGYPEPRIIWSDGHGKVMSTHRSPVEKPYNFISYLHLSNVTRNDTYSCKAVNILGSDTESVHVKIGNAFTVLSQPEETTQVEQGQSVSLTCNIISDSEMKIKWFYNNGIHTKKLFTSDNYSILSNGTTLIIKSMNEDLVGTYTCKAALLNDSYMYKKFSTAVVMSDTEAPYIVKDTSFLVAYATKPVTIPCIIEKGDPKPKVKWQFRDIGEYVDVDISKVSVTDEGLHITQAQLLDNGEYKCIAQNSAGTDEFVTTLMVYKKPEVKIRQGTKIDVMYDGNVTIECDVIAYPRAVIVWRHENRTQIFSKYKEFNSYTHSKILDFTNVKRTMKLYCDSINSQGKDSQAIEVIVTPVSNVENPLGDCLINRRKQSDELVPLLLSINGSWPNYKTQNEFLLIPHKEKLIVSCHNRDEAPNSLTLLPGRSAVEATCAGRDTFWIDGTLYSYSDLHCEREITPVVKRTGDQCLSDNTELIRVGYQMDKFVQVYSVCFDTKNNVPLFSQQRMLSSNNIITPAGSKWFKSLDLPSQNNDIYTCENSSATCCIAKEQLVSGNDVMFGPPRRSTYIDNLNSIPVWTHCDDSRMSWRDVEDILRTLFDTFPEFSVWSGAARYINKDGKTIPQYLWKVVTFDDINFLAIVYVNDPHPKDNQIHCTDLCGAGMIPWLTTTDKYTYCCRLKEFCKAFTIPEEVFRER